MIPAKLTISFILTISLGLGPLGPSQAVGQRRAKKPSRAHLAAVESNCFKGPVNSIALRLPIIAYPRKAARRGVGGKVTIKVFVNEKGIVYYAVPVEGHPLLHEATLRSARAAIFAPFTQNGGPIKCAGLLEYKYNAHEVRPAKNQ